MALIFAFLAYVASIGPINSCEWLWTGFVLVPNNFRNNINVFLTVKLSNRACFWVKKAVFVLRKQGSRLCIRAQSTFGHSRNLQIRDILGLYVNFSVDRCPWTNHVDDAPLRAWFRKVGYPPKDESRHSELFANLLRLRRAYQRLFVYCQFIFHPSYSQNLKLYTNSFDFGGHLVPLFSLRETMFPFQRFTRQEFWKPLRRTVGPSRTRGLETRVRWTRKPSTWEEDSLVLRRTRCLLGVFQPFRVPK